MGKFWGLGLVVLLFVTCAKSTSPPFGLAFAQYSQSTDPAWLKRWWIIKAARALRGGDGLAADEKIAPLLSLSREEVVETFMKDPRFADTVLDFNLFFLGYRQDRIRKENGVYQDIAFELPQAVASAQEAAKNGNFLKLLDFNQKPYFRPLEDPEPNPKLPGDEALSPAQLRIKIGERIQASLDRLIETVRAKPDMPLVEFCPLSVQAIEGEGDPEQLGLARSFLRTYVLGDEWYGLIVRPCYNPLTAKLKILPALQRIRSLNQMLFSKLPEMEPSAYPTPNVAAIREFDFSEFNFKLKRTPFTFPLYRALPNSSTNYNRKRASYMLSRYFCDDLTPINVENPSAHTDGKPNPHGSDESCFACHHKLDPMAGFFKNYGISFRDYSAKSYITFDDGATMDRNSFDAAWLAPSGSSHKFNIGYVKSTKNENLNEYGESLEDLFAIIQRVPEAKRCLVKRMFEYFVSDQQALDPGYLEVLTAEFTKKAKVNSTEAFKSIAAKIVLGNAFSAIDPHSDECYDRPPGAPTDHAPPCKVNFILSRTCAQCHSGGTGAAAGGLDLTAWIIDGAGKRTFPHVDEQGRAVDASTTFDQIANRLERTDKKRMPLGKEMEPADLSALYLWAKAGPQGATP